MTNSFIVRPARESDLETILQYSTAMAKETEGRPLDTTTLRAGIIALMRSPKHGSFILAERACEGRQSPVGQLMITYEWSDWRNGEFWWVQSVYVHPAWRRQGVYRAMHRYILDQAKQQTNICGIRLYVERNNPTAQTVYQRMGLSPTGYLVYEQDFVLPRLSSAPED